MKPGMKSIYKGMKSTTDGSQFTVSPLLVLAVILTFAVIPLSASILVWNYEMSRYIPNGDWNLRLTTYCPLIVNVDADTYYTRSFYQSSTILIAAGAILGQLFEMRCLNLNLSQENWHKTHISFTIVRIILTCIMFGGIMAPFSMIIADSHT